MKKDVRSRLKHKPFLDISQNFKKGLPHRHIGNIARHIDECSYAFFPNHKYAHDKMINNWISMAATGT